MSNTRICPECLVEVLLDEEDEICEFCEEVHGGGEPAASQELDFSAEPRLNFTHLRHMQETVDDFEYNDEQEAIDALNDLQRQIDEGEFDPSNGS